MEKTIKVMVCRHCQYICNNPDIVKLHEDTGQQFECPMCDKMDYTVGLLSWIVKDKQEQP